MEPAIDPKWTVAELLSRVPEARPILAAHRLDTCCGGSHPLDTACAAHGVPLDRVLLEIREAREISAAAQGRASKAAPSPEAARFYPGFQIAALLITLTLGAGSGLFYLWRIGMGADVPLSHRQIHAHSQVLGFAALFIMGIAFHVLPRMLGALPPSPLLRKTVLWLMVSGVVLRNLGQPFAFFWFGGVACFASGILEAAGGLLFSMWFFAAMVTEEDSALQCATSKPAAGPRDPLRVFLPIGIASFLVALALSVMQGAWLAAEGDATLPAPLTEPFYALALFGLVLAFVFGFAGRMMPAFLGIGPARRGTFLTAAPLLAAGAALSAASWIPLLESASLALRDAGALLLALAALVYLAGTGILWRRARAEVLKAPGSPAIAIRLAFGSLALWALLNLASVATARFTMLPARNPWWNDAARHVFTIGFLTLLVVGISTRVLPVFSGKKLAFPRLAQATTGLLALGVVMRLLQYPAAYKPALYVIGSYMGIPVVLALVFFTVNIMKTVRAKPVSAAVGAGRQAFVDRRGSDSPGSFVGTLPAR